MLFWKPSKFFQKSFSNFKFWPETVDRPVDWLYVRSDRSTDRSTGNLTVGCMHVCTFPGRRGGRPEPNLGRSHGRLTESQSLSICFGRPRAAMALLFWNTVDQPVDRGSVFCHNGYFSKHVFILSFSSLNEFRGYFLGQILPNYHFVDLPFNP